MWRIIRRYVSDLSALFADNMVMVWLAVRKFVVRVTMAEIKTKDDACLFEGIHCAI